MSSKSLPTPSFAVLAKRISSWTTNSLLTVLVLVAGLGFGRQVLSWWAADASSLIVPANLDDSSQSHTLRFGDNSWSLCRRSVVGDQEQVVGQLRAACREVLKSDIQPSLSKGEEKLDFLARSTPVEQGPGKWRLYELHDAFPMTVGVLAASNRIAVLGLAVPMGEKQWMLNTFQPASEANPSSLVHVPLPPGGHRTLSLASADGEITSFGGSESTAAWKQFYNKWFDDHGWRTAADWQMLGSAWCAKFANDRASVDVRFGPDDKGCLSGLLMTTPQESR